MITDTAAIATAVDDAPDATVACYDDWTLVELAGHVGQIHRWVTDIVADRAQARPTGPMASAPEPDELRYWLLDGASRLAATLSATPPDTTVWTFSREHADVAFWRDRMVLETALHRWDAEAAIGAAPAVHEGVALAGIHETLVVYLAQRLDGRDVGGAGQRVAVHPEGREGWTVTLRADGLDVEQGRTGTDTVVRGTALDLWLLLTCRRGLEGLVVEGDADAAALLESAARMVPGPAG